MKKLAIVGATGLVGKEVLKVLQEEGLVDEFEFAMFVSDKSAGGEIVFNGKNYILRALSEDIFVDCFDYAIFLTNEDVSRFWVNKFIDNGAVVIDNSSAFRMNKGIPLIVPEINFNSIKNSDKIIANPNCSTIQLVVVLARLKLLAKIKTVVVSSYQSVSGAGKDALNDLKNKTSVVFEHGIVDNIIPQIGRILDGGNCSEEDKIINETKKILNLDIDIYATTVRVPTSFCHGESVFIEFESAVDVEDVKDILNVEHIKTSEDMIPLKVCTGTNFTYVCRIRQNSKNTLQMFIIADNLRRGAAYNAVEILKRLEKNQKKIMVNSQI